MRQTVWCLLYSYGWLCVCCRCSNQSNTFNLDLKKWVSVGKQPKRPSVILGNFSSEISVKYQKLMTYFWTCCAIGVVYVFFFSIASQVVNALLKKKICFACTGTVIPLNCKSMFENSWIHFLVTECVALPQIKWPSLRAASSYFMPPPSMSCSSVILLLPKLPLQSHRLARAILYQLPLKL